ncbi:MAG: 16S rRNA (adenine(1518)-N(6)/adenine(1519)-N(6))-dimethyltransferase RsmA [Pseudomonadota bacterium]
MNSGRPRQHIARKRFGQHFLHDTAVINAIVSAAQLQPDDFVVEIGPGQGALTQLLLPLLDQLHVVELDRDLIPVLKQLSGATQKLVVHEADVLKFDFDALQAPAPFRVIGNLPYNISTPLLFSLFPYGPKIADMLFMLQLEVVQRLIAQPNSAEYGRLSVMAQYHCALEHVLDVSPQAFNPPPKVDSAVVLMRPHQQAPHDVGDPSIFPDLVRQAFAQRRKTLRNNLKGFLSVAQIEACDIDSSQRAQSLSLAQFASLGRQYSQR